MVTALDRFGLYDVVVLVGSTVGVIILVYYFRDVLDSYPGNVENPKSNPRSSGIKSLFTPKTSFALDTRGITDISSAAGTQPSRGSHGGKDNELHDGDATPHTSSALFYRSAKYHPWTDSHRHEQRSQAFEAIYSARLHQP